MSFRLLWGTFPRLSRPPLSRAFASAPPRAARSRLPALGVASGLTLASYLWLKDQPVHADAEEAKREHPSPPLSSFVRAYVVYAMCSVPPLVDWSPQILSTLLSIPVISDVTKALVRVTFFDQFVGGETAEGALPLVEQLRAENKGCLFAYSVEVDEHEAAGKAKGNSVQSVHKECIREMIHSIDVAADFEDGHLPPGSSKGRRTWVAIKLSALLTNTESLVNFSRHLIQNRPAASIAFPGTPHPSDLDVLHQKAGTSDAMTEQDIAALKELYVDLTAVCQHAQERGVKIIIDAEHSWYQPALDAFALGLMSTFNRPSSSTESPNVQPLVLNTYQAYLRRNESHLLETLKTARENGFSLGVKLVRGAYHPHELAAHAPAHSPNAKSSHTPSISPDTLPPVWSTKPETDACYNKCVDILVDAVAADVAPRSSWFGKSSAAQAPTVGVLFGTHNWESCRRVLNRLVEKGLATADGATPDREPIVRIGSEVTERIALAQLYGMHDDLTDYLVGRTRSSTPFVIKYVPYGSLAEVMPYLSRRAIENKSVLGDGAAAAERKRAWDGIKRKLFG
ncbi:FAD-linked oxidoreductase [Phanerochaete sordida]|uniref:Proline dehydrogenase n=1 Tax=Phanerochaete sordida TaxID=48140 RepID=A0A9P3LMY1_9APHY|nr:FAD-linked oxidoreductase [Phanerochaete sordida]